MWNRKISHNKSFASGGLQRLKKHLEVLYTFVHLPRQELFLARPNAKPQPLSAVIITFNEEKNIARCIDSLLTVVDEIIVVDSFSTDKTKEICLGYKNVKFISNEWLGYAKTKNFANNLAQHNYILSLDADEALSPTLINSILNINNFKGVYEFNRLTNYCGKWITHCGWYPDKKIRLFPKNIVYWKDEEIHETIFIPNTLKKKHLIGDLLHYSFYSVEQHLQQIEKFTTLSANVAFEKGEKSSNFKIIYKTVFKFFRDYCLKLGFLDGKYGFIICKNSAYAKYLKYKKLMLLNEKI